MNGADLEEAAERLGLTFTAIAEDINRLCGTRLTVSEISRMKRGEAGGGRDPSPLVVLYLQMRLEQKRKDDTDPVRQLQKELERAGLRVVKAGPPPDRIGTPRRD